MSTFAIVSATPAGATATKTRDLLVERGHTVTIFDQATVVQGDLSAKDAVICVENGSNPTALKTLLDTVMSDDSVPIAVGYTDPGGAAPVADSLASLLGIRLLG